jgi:hypothetical protein
MQQKVKIGYSLHLAENRKTKNKINFHKIATFAKNAACLNPSSHSLSPSAYLHSHHTMPPSNKSSESLSANTTLNHKPEMEGKK